MKRLSEKYLMGAEAEIKEEDECSLAETSSDSLKSSCSKLTIETMQPKPKVKP